jgi:hypothetical protein
MKKSEVALTEDVLELLQLFNLSATHPIYSLPSYEDTNYLVTTGSLSACLFLLTRLDSQKYVLKKYRLGTSEDYIKFQNVIIQTLHENQTSVQEVFFVLYSRKKFYLLGICFTEWKFNRENKEWKYSYLNLVFARYRTHLLVPTHSQEYRLAMCLRTTVARTNIA